MAQVAPSVRSIATTVSSSAAQAHDVNMPASVEAGDLLVMQFNSRFNNITTPAGWTLVPSSHAAQAEGGQKGAIYVKRSTDGSEAGGTVNVTHTGFNAHMTAHVFALSGAGSFLSAATATAANNTTNVDPSNLAPIAYGSRPYLWMTFANAAGAGTWGTFPSGYTTGSSPSPNGATSAYGYKQATAASDNPGVFGQSAGGENLLAWTWVVWPLESQRTETNADDGYSGNSPTFATDSHFIGNGSGITWDSFARIPRVWIPQGATILEAHIEVRAAALLGTASSVASKIHLNAADDATAPTDRTTHVAKTRTTAFASWSPSAWTSGVIYSSPDISAAVQEVVDRAGWAAGNAMMILWDNNASPANNRLGASDLNGGWGFLLVVEYEAGGVVEFTGWGPIPI